MGHRPHRPARSAAQHDVQLHGHRQRRERLHHRHRHPEHPRGVWRARVPRVRRNRRRKRCDGLLWPWYPRVRNSWRVDIRCRQAGAPVQRPRARMHRQWHHLGRHRRCGLGDGEPDIAGCGEHEPRRRNFDHTRSGCTELHRQRCHVHPCGRQRQSQRVQRLAVARRGRYYRRRHHDHRCAVLVLQFRNVRGHLCSGLGYHVGLQW